MGIYAGGLATLTAAFILLAVNLPSLFTDHEKSWLWFGMLVAATWTAGYFEYHLGLNDAVCPRPDGPASAFSLASAAGVIGYVIIAIAVGIAHQKKRSEDERDKKL